MLTILSLVVDYVLVALGSKLFGASSRGAVGAVVGSIAGFFLIPPLGMILFSFLGAMAVEYYQFRDGTQAAKAALGAMLGFFSGTVFKVLLGAYFLVSFIFHVI
jgi:uncharacterized protein YqgC (DUF456 family)